jgi:hypothetical protein
MKTKIIGALAVLSIAAVAAFALNLNPKSNNLTGMSLENAKALAQPVAFQANLTADGGPYPCQETVSYEGEGTIEKLTYCGDCRPILCRSHSGTKQCVFGM